MIKMIKRKGFTLIELLVVISIIGMLTSIVFVSLGGARQKGRDAKKQADLRQIATAMELAYDDSSSECNGEGAYPTSQTTPLRICPTTGRYLNPFPSSPSPQYSYVWVDNRAACGGIPAGQWYCVYTQLESEQNTYFISTQRGTKKITTTTFPANCNCGNL